jgi:hypothetical protein
MKPTIIKRICKLFVIAVTVMAGTVFPEEESTHSPSDPTAVSLTVKRGKPSGRYAAGAQVTIRADAPPTGTRFTGWKGDVQILADPRSPATTATVPFTPVTVIATYSDDSQDSATPTVGAAVASARDEGAEIGMDDFKHDAPGDRADRDAGTKGASPSFATGGD